MKPALLIAAILMLGTGSSARADGRDNDQPKIFPIQSHPYGKSYSQWATTWWRWLVSIPAANNPVLDPTGQNAGLNQSGKVWFLAGNFGGASERTVTVPSGKALFFPILNTIYLGFPCDARNLPGCEADQALANDLAGLLALIRPSMDGVTMACEIDGHPIRNLQANRLESAAIYSIDLGAGNVFGLPAGPYNPSADSGYYLMLAPLTAGHHTIHFKGAQAGDVFSLDVTYHLTVLRDHGGERNDN